MYCNNAFICSCLSEPNIYWGNVCLRKLSCARLEMLAPHLTCCACLKFWIDHSEAIRLFESFSMIRSQVLNFILSWHQASCHKHWTSTRNRDQSGWNMVMDWALNLCYKTWIHFPVFLDYLQEVSSPSCSSLWFFFPVALAVTIIYLRQTPFYMFGQFCRVTLLPIQGFRCYCRINQNVKIKA